MHHRKPVILTFVRYYLPGYKAGGPLRTISNMVEALGDEFDFRIVTSDRDATDTAPYPDMAYGVWKKVGKAQVLYLPPARKGLRQIARILSETPHDILYLNSFFDPVFTQKPLLARWLRLAPKRRCVLAPRGEFSEGALALKSAKKQAFLAAARAAGLYRGLEWQASSEHEEADIRRTLGPLAGRIRIAADLPEMTARQLPPFVPRAPGEPLRVVFLSRISPMKNLDFALEVLREVKVPVRFDIYGPISDSGYWSRCKELIKQLPPSVAATYRGSLEHVQVASALGQSDLLFLPTQGENYGHVIFEALAAGTPVLIADTTPWRNLAVARVGWDLPLGEPKKFAEKIAHTAKIMPFEYTQMRGRAASFATKKALDAEVIQQNICLFTHNRVAQSAN